MEAQRSALDIRSLAIVLVLFLLVLTPQWLGAQDRVVEIEIGAELTTHIDIRIAVSSDDAEERSNGWLYLSSTDLEMVEDGGMQTVGLRFQGVDIPQGASIASATVQFTVDETSAGDASFTIQGELSPDAQAFRSSSRNITSRPRTNDDVLWLPVSWGSTGEAGASQRTPDLSRIIQDIVDQPTWQAGNSLVLIISGSGKRVAEAYDGDPDGAALLHVELGTPVNQPPVVDAGDDSSVALAAAQLDGTVSDDGKPSGTLTTTWSKASGPGEVTFADASAVDTTATFSATGTYLLRLTADDGELQATDDVTITVTEDVNQPPVVEAGVDTSVTLPAAAQLDGTVSDDGKPSGTLTTTWTKVSGPGDVTFADANAVDTSATFSAAGTYLLRLTADDTELQVSDDVTVTVNDLVPPGTTLDIPIRASGDDVEERSNGWIYLGSTDLEMVEDGGLQTVGLRFTLVDIPSGAFVSYATIQFTADETSSGTMDLLVQGESSPNALPFENSGRGVTSRARTSASVSWSPPAWTSVGDAGTAQRTPDISAIVQEIVDNPGWSSGNSLAFIISGTGHRVAEAYDGDPDSTALLHIELGTTVNQPPLVDAGVNTSVTLPDAAQLDGTVSDDGRPSAVPFIEWRVVNGPGDVTFGDATAVDTTATFTVEGTYMLRLTADDGELQASDEVTVTVQPEPPNQAPTVDAGPDASITLPNNASLDGTVSDDGKPDGTLTVAWSKVSGPGDVTFSDAAAVDTMVTFTIEGTYVLRLTADDGELQASDEVAVAVEAAPPISMTLDVRVTASADDAEERSNGWLYLGSSDLEMVEDGGLQTVGLRFNGIDIPQGTSISSATVQFTVDESSSGNASLLLHGQLSPTAETFRSTPRNITARPRTAASVLWSPPAWESMGDASVAQQTPDISPIIQEIVAQPGWVAGNSLVLIISGSGHRVAEAYDGDSDAAPLLHIEVGEAINWEPTVDAGLDVVLEPDAVAQLDGNATDDGKPYGTLATLWERMSGPGAVVFDDATQVDTMAAFAGPGDYVLRLTADDGQYQVSDQLLVTVLDAEANQPPSVFAGANLVVTLPDSAQLDGSITDDGQPNGVLTIVWSVTSGPGNVSFADAHAVDTTASFSAVGFYVLRLTADDGEYLVSDETTVTVEAAPGSSVRFAVLGDYGDGDPSDVGAVADLIKGWVPDLILSTGDNNHRVGNYAAMDANVGQYFSDYIAPYGGIYGPGAGTNQFFPAIGNHDWDMANTYFEYFTLPGNERYYDFVWGPVHFFAIDSDSRESDGTEIGTIQANWLRDQLAASTAIWKIVYVHHPPYSSGGNGSTRDVQWPYKEWGATAVLSGHDHLYERIIRDGMLYFVNGLGGYLKGWFESPISGSQARYNAEFGAMLVDATQYQIHFRFINVLGETIDTFTMEVEATER